MKSVQALHTEHLTLHRRLQAHYNQIAFLKGGANLLASFVNPLVRRQSLQAIASERKGVEHILLQLQEVQERYVAALFVEAWEEEFARLPDVFFLTEETRRRQNTYADCRCPSFTEHPPSFFTTK